MAHAAEKRAPVGMTWAEVCADPSLQDLPFKIELNEWGQIVMSPTRVLHGAYQARLARLLSEQAGPQGMVVTECAVRTAKGTKVADVAWISPERWQQVKDEFDCSIAPEICIEILSPRNAEEEIEMKRRLYFEAGAEEVWICDAQGTLRFYTSGAQLPSSRRLPAFPEKIEL